MKTRELEQALGEKRGNQAQDAAWSFLDADAIWLEEKEGKPASRREALQGSLNR